MHMLDLVNVQTYYALEKRVCFTLTWLLVLGSNNK